MPVIFRHKSFRFFFYSNEGNPREAMHVHIRNAEGGARQILVDSRGLLGGQRRV